MELSKKDLKYQIVKFKLIKEYPFLYHLPKSDDPVIYLFFAACGTNMGDHAIVKAEKEYIEKAIGHKSDIVEILTRESESAIRQLKKKIRKQDLIILSGGGYLGDEYVEVYSPMCRLLKTFAKNQILIFPQTVFFHSKKKEQYFMELCKKCKNLYIYLRERESKSIFDKYGINAELVPDIVLTIPPKPHYEYNGKILLCLRNDVEKLISKEQEQIIRDELEKFGDVVITDTVYPNVFPLDRRNEKLQKIWKNFSECSLVVTDRIHGMVFSYITNTPCIAVGNYNHKVESEYKWLETSENIKFIKDIGALADIVPVLFEKRSNNKAFVSEFDSVAERVKKCFEQKSI